MDRDSMYEKKTRKEKNCLFIQFVSSTPMEQFDLDFQEEISVKQAKTYLFKNNKNTLKNTCCKANSTIRRLLASLDIV